MTQAQAQVQAETAAQAIVRTVNEEEIEYGRRLHEIEAQKRRIVDLQADLETLKRALARFELEYRARVGPFLVEIERIRLELAEYRRRITWLRAGVAPDPDGVERDLQAEFAERREEVRAEAEETRRYQQAFRQERARPPMAPDTEAELRRLYRELAKRFHPDLAASAEERGQREEIMLRINAAFRERDLDGLRALERETERDDPAFAARSLTEKLAWTEREISRLDAAIQDLEAHVALMRRSDTFELWCTPESAKAAISRLAENARTKRARLQDRLDDRKLIYRRLTRRRR